MTQLVVDASVAIKWVYAEDGSDLAVALLAHDLSAPELLASECANVLWKMATRGELEAEGVMRRAVALQAVRLQLEPMRGLMASAIDMAVRLGHPAYDCFYLALASSARRPFVTADLKLIRKLRAAGFGEAEVLSLAEAAALAA